MPLYRLVGVTLPDDICVRDWEDAVQGAFGSGPTCCFPAQVF